MCHRKKHSCSITHAGSGEGGTLNWLTFKSTGPLFTRAHLRSRFFFSRYYPRFHLCEREKMSFYDILTFFSSGKMFDALRFHYEVKTILPSSCKVLLRHCIGLKKKSLNSRSDMDQLVLLKIFSELRYMDEGTKCPKEVRG